MTHLFSIMIQLVLMLGLAPLVDGIIKKIKAFSQKRQGPLLFQPYYDLYKLFRKETVVSETASWVFTATPFITFAAVLTATLFIPVSIRLDLPSFGGDLFLAVYLLALGRFFMTLAALDPGSTFGGMGSSREMMVATLTEPTLLVIIFTLGLSSGSTSAHRMMHALSQLGSETLQPVYLLLCASLIIILLTETARIPVDDPATHLELTMVHEAMLLEYSGKHLGLMNYASSLKQLFFITLTANLFFPLDGFITISAPGLALLFSLLAYLAKVVLVSVLIGLIEINTVKLRLFTMPNLAALAFILAFLGFFQYLIFGR